MPHSKGGTIAEGAGSGNNSRRPSADLSAISNSLDFQSHLSRPPSEGEARASLGPPVTDLSQLLNMRKLKRRTSGLGGGKISPIGSTRSISFLNNSFSSLNDDVTETDEPVQNANVERPMSEFAAMVAATLGNENDD